MVCPSVGKKWQMRKGGGGGGLVLELGKKKTLDHEIAGDRRAWLKEAPAKKELNFEIRSLPPFRHSTSALDWRVLRIPALSRPDKIGTTTRRSNLPDTVFFRTGNDFPSHFHVTAITSCTSNRLPLEKSGCVQCWFHLPIYLYADSQLSHSLGCWPLEIYHKQNEGIKATARRTT